MLKVGVDSITEECRVNNRNGQVNSKKLGPSQYLQKVGEVNKSPKAGSIPGKLGQINNWQVARSISTNLPGVNN
jgi:hypothetical protein